MVSFQANITFSSPLQLMKTPDGPKGGSYWNHELCDVTPPFMPSFHLVIAFVLGKPESKTMFESHHSFKIIATLFIC